jgi:hypothetical protein
MNVLASLIKQGQRKFAVIALAGGVAASGTMVYTASSAAFTASTDNPTNNWVTGSVVLSDDDSNGAMFNIDGTGGTAKLVSSAGGGGSVLTGVKCIKVTYTGDQTAAVKFHVAAGFTNPATTDGGNPTAKLGDYINLKVEQGTGSDFSESAANCTTNFVSDAASGPGGDGVWFDNNLTNFTTTRTNYGNGAPASGTGWSPTASGQSRVYKITWDATALPDAQRVMGKTFTCTFTWSAKSV